MWWESNIKGFFPVGEVSGTHGVYRPGGSALNSGQCGGMRAAMAIAKRGEQNTRRPEAAPSLTKEGKELIRHINKLIGDAVLSGPKQSNISAVRQEIGELMSRCAAHIRDEKNIARAVAITKEKYLNYWETVKLGNTGELPAALQNRDLLIAQYVYLTAMLDYIRQGGTSRGSYLIAGRGDPGAPQIVSDDMIQEILLINGEAQITWRKRRPIPDAPRWFETVWNEYTEKEGNKHER
jgi:succinate dehydrogenase/fumarate reductase flavoprotein subunit